MDLFHKHSTTLKVEGKSIDVHIHCMFDYDYGAGIDAPDLEEGESRVKIKVIANAMHETGVDSISAIVKDSTLEYDLLNVVLENKMMDNAIKDASQSIIDKLKLFRETFG